MYRLIFTFGTLVTALIVVPPAPDWLRPATAALVATAAATSTASDNSNLRELIHTPSHRTATPGLERHAKVQQPARRIEIPDRRTDFNPHPSGCRAHPTARAAPSSARSPPAGRGRAPRARGALTRPPPGR